MKITAYKNTIGEDCVLVEYEDGSTWSGYKSAWDLMNVDSESNQ